MIGQFGGPYSAVKYAEGKTLFVTKCFLIYRQVFLTLITGK